jgi:hypothetical protein
MATLVGMECGYDIRRSFIIIAWAQTNGNGFVLCHNFMFRLVIGERHRKT